MDDKFHNILQSEYSSNTWWMLAGDAIYGKILILGDIPQYDLEVIKILAKYVEQYDVENLDRYFSQYIDSCTEIFDLIIINKLDNKKLSDRILSKIRSQNKTENAQVLIFEINFYRWKSFFLYPINFLKSLFCDVRKKEIQSYFKGNAVSQWGSFTNGNVPYESYSKNIYYNNKNSFSFHEKIKTILFNTSLSRVFFDSQIFFVSKNNIENNLITACINSLNSNDSINCRGGKVTLVKMQYKIGKLILSFGTDGNIVPNYLLVFPLDRECYNQRNNEKEVIKQVAKITEIKHLFVDEIIIKKVCGFPYFAMKEFHGITVDIENSLFSKMTSNAVNIIKNISRYEISQEMKDNELSEKIVGDYFDLLELKYPQYKERILVLRQLFFIDNFMVLVKMFHGDMKLENFVFNQQTGEVIGIIDLELAQIPGPALLDLYYLITYNYQSIYKKNFLTVFNNLINESIKNEYLNFIHEYCLLHGISNKYRKHYLVLLFVHHYSRRFSFSDTNDFEQKQFTSCLELSIRLLESKS